MCLFPDLSVECDGQRQSQASLTHRLDFAAMRWAPCLPDRRRGEGLARRSVTESLAIISAAG